MSRSRIIKTRDGGTITLPDVEANGVTALGCWVALSDIPGTPSWEWCVTNIPVWAVTGMTSGYEHTCEEARNAALQALDFWESYGYNVNRDGAR